MVLYSLEIERHFLSGLINNPKIYYDLDGLVSDGDFFNDSHQTIFSVLRSLILSDEKFDKTILGQKIKNLGIKLQDNLNIFEYIESLAFLKIKSEATIESAKELVKFRIRRQIYQAATNIQELVKKDQNGPIEKLVSEAEALFSKDISIFDYDDEIEYLYDDLERFIEERGNNPVQETGLVTGYPEYNRIYGALRNGNLYCVVSRAGEGKSSLLQDMVYDICKLNPNVEALILDTEMSSEETKLRIVSARTDVRFWYLDTGNFRKNYDLTKQVREGLKNAGKPRIAYCSVGNKTVEQICSLARRWKMSKVAKGSKAILCYDYVKLTGEKVSDSWKEYQSIGDKIDKLKKLSEKKSIDCPVLTAMQQNRIGDSFAKKHGESVTDDSTTISTSDRLLWFASYVGIYRRKTEDEISVDGVQFGTHKLITLKSRFQGRDSAGHFDFLKRTFPNGDEKWARNYINFEINNFRVTEKGSLKHCIESYKEQINLQGDKPVHDGDVM